MRDALPSRAARYPRSTGFAVIVGAAGGSLILGTVWAFLAKAKYDHALTTECGGNPNSCSPQGIADGRTAHDQALVATMGFVGAAVFVAGAATVYFAWPTTQDRMAVAPAVSSAGAPPETCSSMWPSPSWTGPGYGTPTRRWYGAGWW